MSQSAVLESPFNRLIDPLLPPLSASALDVYQIVTAIKKKERLHFKILLVTLGTKVKTRSTFSGLKHVQYIFIFTLRTF